MKKLFFLIIIGSSLHAIAQTEGINNPFNNEIQSIKTDLHSRIDETKIFIILPTDYEIEYWPGIQTRKKKDNKIFLDFFESKGISFFESKTKMIEEMPENIEIFTEEFTYQSYPAYYVSYVNPPTSESKKVLIFGNEEFLVKIGGNCELDNPEYEIELTEILKSVYYDSTFDLNPFETASFSIDHKAIGFNNVYKIENEWFIINENGSNDIKNPFSNSILITNVLDLRSENQIYSTAKRMISLHKRNEITIFNQELTEKMIGEYNALILDSNISRLGKEGIIYQVVLTDGKKVLSFSGVSYSNSEELKIKYQEIVKTIRFN